MFSHWVTFCVKVYPNTVALHMENFWQLYAMIKKLWRFKVQNFVCEKSGYII